MKTHEQQFGETGESAAVKFLKKLGYKIIKRNYRTKAGEIDIIAKDGKTIVFVEVKARRSPGYNPKAAVTRSKQRKISITALHYLKTNNLLRAKARFDVVAIGSKNSPENFELIKNAFELAYG
jgi:putative endonuclease